MIKIHEIAMAFQQLGHRASPRLILRAGLSYKKHLNKETTPHKSEDYQIRLIDAVFHRHNLNDRMEYKGVIWSRGEYKNKIISKSTEILENLSNWKRGGRNPFILMGAIIYLADKLLAIEFKQKAVLTQQMISEVTTIPEYSIRDHYVNLLKPLFIKY